MVTPFEPAREINAGGCIMCGSNIRIKETAECTDTKYTIDALIEHVGPMDEDCKIFMALYVEDQKNSLRCLIRNLQDHFKYFTELE